MNTNVEDLRAQLARFRGFLQQDPDNFKLTDQVADLHLRLGEIPQARALLEQALMRWPSHPVLVFRRAKVALASDESSLAVQLLKGLAASDNKDPVVCYDLAYAYLQNGQAAEAKRELLDITDSTESIPQIDLLLARAAHHLGDVQAALKHARTYTEKCPNDSEGLGVLALLHLDAGHNPPARAAAEKAFSLEPSNLDALVTLGSVALTNHDAQQAAAYFEKAVERAPASGRSRAGLGLARLLDGDIDGAAEQLQLATKYMPRHLGSWHTLAWCQILRNDVDGAENSLLRSQEINPNFSETHGGLAIVHLMRNLLEPAQQEIKEALRLDPQCVAAQIAQTLYKLRSDPKKTQEMLQNVFATPSGQLLQDLLQRAMAKGPGSGKN